MPATPIGPDGVAPGLAMQPGVKRPASAEGGGFADALQDYLHDVNDMQAQAEQAVTGLATGKVDNLHQVVVAMSEADLSFRLMMEIRNKLLGAYQEINKMQV